MVVGGGRAGRSLQRAGREAALDPPHTVLLLNEPTAHLDAASEALVIAELRALAARGALVLAVAHRPALRADADRVVTLETPAVAAPVRAKGTLARIERPKVPFARNETPPPRGRAGLGVAVVLGVGRGLQV